MNLDARPAPFLILALLGVVCLLAPGAAFGQGTAARAGALRVVVAGSEPFVSASGAPEGLSIDVWTAVARELELDFELERADDVIQALDMVADRIADVAVGPISITAERSERVRFTQPYFYSSLGILTSARGTLLDRFAPFLTTAFTSGALALLAVLALVGMLLWIAERRANPEHFPSAGLAGIGNGIWMALVTMTTVGYGDRVPHTFAGRVITGVWMLMSLVIASSLTAFLATAMTLSQMDDSVVETAEELRGRWVGVVAASTSEDFAAGFGGRVLPSQALEDAVGELEAGDADVVVFDRPALQYFMNQRPELGLSLSEARYMPQNYGFVANIESPLADDLSLGILRLRESGELDRIEAEWLGR
jgi:polar amino acid transport system substrate-binding protein